MYRLKQKISDYCTDPDLIGEDIYFFKPLLFININQSLKEEIAKFGEASLMVVLLKQAWQESLDATWLLPSINQSIQGAGLYSLVVSWS